MGLVSSLKRALAWPSRLITDGGCGDGSSGTCSVPHAALQRGPYSTHRTCAWRNVKLSIARRIASAAKAFAVLLSQCSARKRKCALSRASSNFRELGLLCRRVLELPSSFPACFRISRETRGGSLGRIHVEQPCPTSAVQVLLQPFAFAFFFIEEGSSA